MVGFKTNNSIYLIDSENKKISGGVFKNAIHSFEKAIIIIGLPAEILLSDGRTILTSRVKSYL